MNLTDIRICELLDYADEYGEINEHLPDGIHTIDGRQVEMNTYRRSTILAFKELLRRRGVDPEARHIEGDGE